jgi:hypothetical protein
MFARSMAHAGRGLDRRNPATYTAGPIGKEQVRCTDPYASAGEEKSLLLSDLFHATKFYPFSKA